jgi:cation diffusion facilitator family transporter
MTPVRLQVRRVLLITLLLNMAVAAGKIVLGSITGALAITADGFHSLTDGTGNIAGLIGNHFASLPPDDDHPYGHRRYETLAALLIGGLLLLTAWEIGSGALERLHASAVPTITPLSFGVLIITLIINIGVSRYQMAAGNRLKSEVLLADAKNTSSDVWVTLSVIFSTALVALTGWWWLDIAAALLVMGLIGRAALQILGQTGKVLVDTAPVTPEKLIGYLPALPGVLDILRARSRGTADAMQIDIDVQVAPAMTAEQTTQIAAVIREKLTEKLTGIEEIEVHFVAQHTTTADAALIARAYADRLGLTTHEVRLLGATLEMHVEVPPGQTLQQAHQQVSTLEATLQDALPTIAQVVTHIEPAFPVVTANQDTTEDENCTRLKYQVLALLAQHYPSIGWHDACVHATPGSFALTLHAALPAEISIEAAHSIAESAETLLRSQLPQLARVTIHTEPEDMFNLS